jgi:hypothetical protein
MEQSVGMNEELKDHLTNPAAWLRLLYMILFVIIFNVLELVIALVVFLQVILTLFTGARNERVLEFGDQLSGYAYQILQYLTYNTDQAPFPFMEWSKSTSTRKHRGGTGKKSTGKRLAGESDKGDSAG